MRDNPQLTDRIRWLLDQATRADSRGERDLASRFRAMADDLGPAPASRVSS